MVYYGAAHYYFWQGIRAGLNNELKNMHDYPEAHPLFKGENFNKFADAFIEGYLWGMAMTEDDYKRLTEMGKTEKKTPQPRKKIEKKAKVSIPNADESTMLPGIKGNC